MSPKRKRPRRYVSSPTHSVLSEMELLSPSEKMKCFREAEKHTKTRLYTFEHGLGFTLDAFQREAMEGVEAGDSVLVAAPTGAGKTVVGEFALDLAMSKRCRAFYTTPIKALSNQKFLDLRRRFGEENVGLLTGDMNVKPQAPIVVMTTEVLRNMIYAGNDLRGLTHVVLDEVHYLADRFRGPVWEEVIIHLPAHVAIVGLSATVSNAEEFGAWMREVRSSCKVVVSESRPVPLYQHMMVDSALYDLYTPSSDRTGSSGHLNPELLSAVERLSKNLGTGRHGTGRGIQKERRRGLSLRRESRATVLITLDRARLLPAIVFIFSRAGCEDAVKSVHRSGIILTTSDEAQQIRTIVDETLAMIPIEDHGILNLNAWASALECGIAAHHAGLLPIMKEAVEKLFMRGLVKVVYATETLALGINMPARTVVIESLTKWNGIAHQQLSAGEYTQLSGRAGRRGIDKEGHAVVLHRGRIAPEEVAALASKRTYPLNSAFHPTYNMVVNLLAHSSRAATREVLETSFAQFQADGAVVTLARRLRENQHASADYESFFANEEGNVLEYFQLCDELSQAEKTAAKQRRAQARNNAEIVIRSLLPGQVIRYRPGRRREYSLVVSSPILSLDSAHVAVLGMDGQVQELNPSISESDLEVVGRVPNAQNLSIRKNRERMHWAEELRRLVRSGALKASTDSKDNEESEIASLRQRIRMHPIHHSPRKSELERAGYAWNKIMRERVKLSSQIDARTNSVAKEFDRVCSVLDDCGFLDGETITLSGEQLRRVFCARALTVVESVTSGAWDSLSPAELAAIVSSCIYEGRGDRDSDVAPRIPARSSLARAWDHTCAIQSYINSVERKNGAQLTPELDPGLVEAIAAWASGSSLSTAILGTELQGGDFVRWARQVCDLLDQLRHLAIPELSEHAYQARQLIERGVVAWETL